MPRSSVVAAAAALLATSLSSQTPVTVDLVPDRDNTLYEDENGTLSNGAGSRVFTGVTLIDEIRRALVRFDVAAAVPPCSTIQSVSLSMTVARTIATPEPVSLHRTLADWGEAGSIAPGQQGAGGAAQPMDATWKHTFSPNRFWQNPGGDFDPQASATTTVGGVGAYTWSSTSALVADVQGWVDRPSSNFGWTVLTDETKIVTARAFHSREATVPANRPTLQIVYVPPSASVTPSGAGCAGSGASPLAASAVGLPTLDNRSFALAQTGGPAAAARAFGLGFRLASQPIPIGAPGCSLLLDPGLPIVVLGAPGGTLPLPIPNNASLLGQSLATQGAAADASTGLLVLSNALVLKIGV